MFNKYKFCERKKLNQRYGEQLKSHYIQKHRQVIKILNYRKLFIEELLKDFHYY